MTLLKTLQMMMLTFLLLSSRHALATEDNSHLEDPGTKFESIVGSKESPRIIKTLEVEPSEAGDKISFDLSVGSHLGCNGTIAGSAKKNPEGTFEFKKSACSLKFKHQEENWKVEESGSCSLRGKDCNFTGTYTINSD